MKYETTPGFCCASLFGLVFGGPKVSGVRDGLSTYFRTAVSPAANASVLSDFLRSSYRPARLRS